MSCRFELDELLVELLIENQNGSCIVATVAVVGSRPHSHQLLIEHLFITLHNQLMGPHDFSDIVVVVECINDIPSKEITRTSRTQHPALDI